MFKVGDIVRVKNLGSHFISIDDWNEASGKTYRIAKAYQDVMPDSSYVSFLLEGSPYSLSVPNGYAGRGWWWPESALELAERHPAEVF